MERMERVVVTRPPRRDKEEGEIKRRVKVFSFGDSNVWEDLGTGYVTKDYIEVTRGEVLTITVRSEYDGSIIIQSKVLPDRTYKVQEVRWYIAPQCSINPLNIFVSLGLGLS